MKAISNLVNEPTKKKILLLGRPGTGKTSIKKVIFEGESPKTLIANPLEPTFGLIPKKYSWLDLDLGVFDSSGQELDHLLQTEENQTLSFESADAIIYMFDFNNWNNQQNLITNDITNINQIIELNYPKSRFFLFYHKIDLLPKDECEKEIEKIKENFYINKKGIFFTSIFPDLLYTIYNAFYQILSKFSEETKNLKEIIDDRIKTLTNTMCFVTNKFNSIVVQGITKDFDINLINNAHILPCIINQAFEEIYKDDKIEHVIVSSANNLNFIIKSFRTTKFDLKNIVILSQTLTANKLIWLIGEIKLKFNEYIFHGKISKEIPK